MKTKTSKRVFKKYINNHSSEAFEFLYEKSQNGMSYDDFQEAMNAFLEARDYLIFKERGTTEWAEELANKYADDTSTHDDS